MGLPGDELGWDGVGRVDLKQFQRSDSIEMHILFYSKLKHVLVCKRNLQIINEVKKHQSQNLDFNVNVVFKTT